MRRPRPNIRGVTGARVSEAPGPKRLFRACLDCYTNETDPRGTMQLIESIVADAEQMRAVRREIHAHPELGYQEQRTSDLIARKLTEWGIPVQRGLGKTGVLGIIQNGSSPRAVGLRADMDCLPITEHNQFAHASKN